MHHESTPGITQELGDDARQRKKKKREIIEARWLMLTKSLQFLSCLNVLWIKIIQVSVRKI